MLSENLLLAKYLISVTAALRILDVQYVQESICFELKIGNKTSNYISLTIPKPKSRWLWNIHWKPWIKFRWCGAKEFVLSNWFCQDKTSFGGDAIKNLTTQFGLHQVIKELTHLRYFFLFVSWPYLYVTVKFDNWVRQKFIRLYIQIVIIR